MTSFYSEGSGMGLYIAKSICDRYGWKIDLRSTLGKGTTAVLTFERGSRMTALGRKRMFGIGKTVGQLLPLCYHSEPIQHA